MPFPRFLAASPHSICTGTEGPEGVWLASSRDLGEGAQARRLASGLTIVTEQRFD
jgi:hypothetical protein